MPRSQLDIEVMPNSKKAWALIAGPVLAFLTYWLMPDQFVNASGETVAFAHAGKACAAVTVLMAVWWFTEALPIAVTAMLPLVLYPILEIATAGATMKHYASGTIFLFLGGFLLAAAIHRWRLDRRIALYTISLFGTKPNQMVLGLMLSTAFISAWVSNTATAAMMVPIAIAVIGVVRSTQNSETPSKDENNFAIAVLLAIAYAASIGGLATLVGSPPNGIFARFVEDRYGEPVSFLAWMRVSLPVTLLLLPATYFVLTKLLFRTKLTGIPGGKEWVKNEIAKLGPMSAGEKVVLVVFALAAVLWMYGPLVRGFEIDGVRPFKALSDEAIAMGAGLILFMIPIDVKRGVHALDWDSTKDVVAWDVLLLFGGGLTMAAAIQATGLADLIGAQASVFAGASRFSMMLGVSALTTFASEVTSNTALAATIMPLIAAVCDTLKISAEGPLFATVIGASAAFMMPVGTPPNAIVFGTGRLKISDMIKAGFILNIFAIFIGVGCSYFLGNGILPV